MLGNREIRVGLAKADEGSPLIPSRPIIDISKDDAIEILETTGKVIVGGAVTIIAAKSLSEAIGQILVHHGTK